MIAAAAPDDNDIVLDFFAGSGTTGHAVINLNREDGGRRKFILVEMADYFDTALLPRIKKVVFTPEWQDGQPRRLATQEEAERSPRIIKVIRLESYEDTLNNLELKRTPEQSGLLGLDTWDPEKRAVREDYVLRYMLDVESRGSLLNVEAFEDPFAYRLKIVRDGDTRHVTVDLVETFNWLLGLRVRTMREIDGVRVVAGEDPEGKRVLVLWRNVKETDNDKLDAWFRKQGYNAETQDFDLVYVNGDNNLQNLRRQDQSWEVRLIEAEFHRLMFDVEDV